MAALPLGLLAQVRQVGMESPAMSLFGGGVGAEGMWPQWPPGGTGVCPTLPTSLFGGVHLVVEVGGLIS